MLLVVSLREGALDELLASRCLEGDGNSRGPEGTRTFSRRVLRRRWLRLGRSSSPAGLEADAGMEGLRKVVSVSAGSVMVRWNLRRTRFDSASTRQYCLRNKAIFPMHARLTLSARVILHAMHTLVQMGLGPQAGVVAGIHVHAVRDRQGNRNTSPGWGARGCTCSLTSSQSCPRAHTSVSYVSPLSSTASTTESVVGALLTKPAHSISAAADPTERRWWSSWGLDSRRASNTARSGRGDQGVASIAEQHGVAGVRMVNAKTRPATHRRTLSAGLAPDPCRRSFLLPHAVNSDRPGRVGSEDNPAISTTTTHIHHINEHDTSPHGSSSRGRSGASRAGRPLSGAVKVCSTLPLPSLPARISHAHCRTPTLIEQAFTSTRHARYR